MKITIILKPGIRASQDEYEFEANYVTESVNGFLDVVRRINPRTKTYYIGALWWKKQRSYIEYDYETLVMFRKKDVIAVALGEVL